MISLIRKFFSTVLFLFSFLNIAQEKPCVLGCDVAKYSYPQKICRIMQLFKAGALEDNFILLYGQPKSGKSRLARLMAEEMGFECIEFNGYLNPRTTNFILSIEETHQQTGKPVVVIFDNIETETKFTHSFKYALGAYKASPEFLFIFITSQYNTLDFLNSDFFRHLDNIQIQ